MVKDFVIAVGGSIVCPDEINIKYLKSLNLFIRSEIKEGKRFILVVGGGGPARKFQKAAGEIAIIKEEDKDWLGIHATRINAHLLRTIFYDIAHPVILEERGKIQSFDKYSLIIAAGWKPGWSTDFVAIQIAVDFNLNKAIILGKPDYVYNKDNNAFKDAVPFKEINWEDYLKLIPEKWSPGIHAPVDPVAARLAREKNIKVIVAYGGDLKNTQKIINEDKFLGTIIKN